MPIPSFIRSRFSLVLLAVGVACGGDSGPTGPVEPTAASVTISGAATSEIGQTTKLTAVAKDSAGAVLPNQVITWSSSESAVIGVGADGTVTATRIGSVTITAKAGAATATRSFTTSLTPYTFDFPAGTSAADMQTIRDGVQYAHAYHLTVFNRVIVQPTTVTGSTSAAGCSAGGAAAFTGLKAVTFCLANQGWTANGAIQKQKIVQHELFHVWQFEYKWLGNPATAGAMWVIEGSAELMGFRGIAAKNLLDFDTAIGCQIKQVADFTIQRPPGLPALISVESQQVFQTTQGPLYAQSMLAMDQLVKTPGLVALKVYGDAIAGGTTWPAAFQTAFNTSTTAFYAQFPAYRASQNTPQNYLCGV